ncbi:MAG TPA: C-terminal helicase domain-containing protein, partial [Acidobacteriota bacterium]
DRLVEQLGKEGVKAGAIHGDLRQANRERTLKDFTEGKLHVLVATDVAARGLHIEGLDMVVNYDLPGESENYVHRIGRTARAGKSGKAVTLACEKYIANLEGIETLINAKIPVVFPEDEMFLRDKSRGMIFPRSGGPAGRGQRTGPSHGGRPQSGRPQGGRPHGGRPGGRSRHEQRRSF